jgi:hypothetical protein
MMTATSLLVVAAASATSLYTLETKTIGIRRKLGTLLSHNTRRLGLLERWYVAHSRAGHHHTGLDSVWLSNVVVLIIAEIRMHHPFHHWSK